jgi:CubicO group peptidase (beta-lactamase class C family)
MIQLNHKHYHVPGIMAASAQGSHAPQAVSSGVGDVSLGTPWPLNGCVKVGQLTESFTVALMLQCVGEHSLNLDASLSQVSKKFTRDNGRLRLIVEEYNQLKPVTIRDLLQHTSGLPSYEQTSAYVYRMSKNPRKVWQMEAYLDLITGADVEYCYGYWKAKRGVHALSATNYLLAGLVLEAVTGYQVSELMAQLFEQHGLADSSYSANGRIEEARLAQLVHGYLPVSFPYADIFTSLPVLSYNDSRELRAYDVTGAYNLNGLAGMAALSSVIDLVQWMRILWREQYFGDPMPVFFAKPVPIHRDGNKRLGEFGMGFRRAKLYPYGELVWAKGRVYGYEALMGYSLDKDITFALAVNSNRSPLRVLTGSEMVDDFLTQLLGT